MGLLFFVVVYFTYVNLQYNMKALAEVQQANRKPLQTRKTRGMLIVGLEWGHRPATRWEDS